MVTKSEKRRRRGKTFIIALIALIFAETGYILFTTGLGWRIFGPRDASPTTDFTTVLSVSQAYVFFNGTVSAVTTPPRYDNAYVYLVLYRPGIQLPQALTQQISLDAAERPVYVLPVLEYNTPINPADFAEALPTNAKKPVILLTYTMDKFEKIRSWIIGVENTLHATLSGSYIRVELADGLPKSVKFF